MPSRRRVPMSGVRLWWVVALALLAGLLAVPVGTAQAAPSADVASGGFVSVNATRLLDTRNSSGPVPAGKSVAVPVTGVDGLRALEVALAAMKSAESHKLEPVTQA